MAEVSKADIEAIRKSGLIDEEWYVREYPDVKALRMDAAEHYLRFGAKLGRKPSPKADNVAHLNGAGVKATLAEGRPVISPALANSAKTRNSTIPGTPISLEAIEGYLAMRQDVATSGLWDENWYLSQYYFQLLDYKRKAGADRYVTPLDHYLKEGWRVGCEPSKLLPIREKQKELNENKVAYFLNKLRFKGYQFEENIWLPDPRRVQGYMSHQIGRSARGVVYTCIVGRYDNLMQPYHIADDWDYVCFTDDPDLIDRKTVGVWSIRPLDSGADPSKTNRWHKMHPHLLFPEYKESIYVDGNINILSTYIYDQIGQRELPMLLPRHFIRNCIYEELDALLHSPRFSEAEKRDFKTCRDFLVKERFPAGLGLTENNLIYRKHHDAAVVHIMSQWWDCYNKHPPRDQTSLAYVFWKNRLNITQFTFANCRVNYRDFWVVKHNAAAPAAAVDKIAAKALRPAFQTNNICVVFSTNEYFVPYLGVAVFSLIKNASKAFNYDIIILGRGLSDKAQRELGALANSQPNVSIRFYDMGEIFASLPSEIFHVEGYVPVETYNKCFITKVLSGYDRCLYLDSDIVILDDVQKLHDTPLEGCAIAASVNVANVNAAYCRKDIKGRKFDQYLQNELGVREQERYFQAGILVLDMNALNEMDLYSTSLATLKKVKQPIFFDQCIFNRIFYNNVKFVSTAWNHVWYMQNYSYLRGSVPDDVFFDYARGRTDPKIIHFASKDKPHTKIGWELGDVFWKYAYASPFINEILQQLGEANNDVTAAMRSSTSGNAWYDAPKRVLIHVHLYYVDQLDRMLEALANVTDCEFSLFVTMVEKDELAERRIKRIYSDATVMVVPNVGYDIFPFLHVLQQVRLANYSYILKLHTKNRREPGQDVVYGIKVPGHQWRDELIDALAGSKAVFSRNLKTLSEDKNVGCVGAARFVFSTSQNREEETYKLPDWRKRCGISTGQRYVGGSMFLARAYPFERLKGLRLRPEDFKAPQMGTKDHKNTAHIVERLLGIVIESEGFEIRGA